MGTQISSASRYGDTSTSTPDSAIGPPPIEQYVGVGSRARIAIVGDYQADHEAHPATTAAIDHAGQASGAEVVSEWIATNDSEQLSRLGDYQGVWIAPGSPYQSLEGALGAITEARTAGLPLLGTCAGFQHIVIEFARNVVGDTAATHAEYDPTASSLFVTPLSCSLAGSTFPVRFSEGSRAHSAYGTDSATEHHYCKFGLNPDKEALLAEAGLSVSGRDNAGDARVIEISEHPFFVGTLFVPQMSSSPQRPHPLLKAFVDSALKT